MKAKLTLPRIGMILVLLAAFTQISVAGDIPIGPRTCDPAVETCPFTCDPTQACPESSEGTQSSGDTPPGDDTDEGGLLATIYEQIISFFQRS